MELVTISQLSKLYSISTRTLRYYEEIGLIESHKQEGYAYRMYDERTRIQLQQILILRKLRIKLNEIAKIINNDTVDNILELLCANLKDINEEMNVPMPLKKKYFEGGLYAAHCIKMGNFEEWKLITEEKERAQFRQLDLLIPIKKI